MPAIEQTSKDYFKELTILHLAMLVGQVLMAAILYYIHEGNYTSGLDFRNIFSILVLAAVIIGFAGSFFIPKKMIEKAKTSKDLKEKMGRYRAALVVKWAFLESGTMVPLILFYITGNLTFLMMGGAMIAFFASTNPSPKKAIQELNLKQAEQRLLHQADEIITRINRK